MLTLINSTLSPPALSLVVDKIQHKEHGRFLRTSSHQSQDLIFLILKLNFTVSRRRMILSVYTYKRLMKSRIDLQLFLLASTTKSCSILLSRDCLKNIVLSVLLFEPEMSKLHLKNCMSCCMLRTISQKLIRELYRSNSIPILASTGSKPRTNSPSPHFHVNQNFGTRKRQRLTW